MVTVMALRRAVSLHVAFVDIPPCRTTAITSHQIESIKPHPPESFRHCGLVDVWPVRGCAVCGVLSPQRHLRSRHAHRIFIGVRYQLRVGLTYAFSILLLRSTPPRVYQWWRMSWRWRGDADQAGSVHGMQWCHC